MTLSRIDGYSASMLNGWQHLGSFVIKFSPETNQEEGSFVGRVEHVASGKTTRFESADALVSFINDVLNKVRHEFHEAETLSIDYTD